MQDRSVRFSVLIKQLKPSDPHRTVQKVSQIHNCGKLKKRSQINQALPQKINQASGRGFDLTRRWGYRGEVDFRSCDGGVECGGGMMVKAWRGGDSCLVRGDNGSVAIIIRPDHNVGPACIISC